MSGVDLAQLLLLTGLLTALLVAAGSAALYPRLRGRLARLAPAPRARALLAWATAPLWIGAGLVGLCLLPSVAALAWPALDHCLAHGDHHVHLCVSHGPGMSIGAFGQALLALAGAGALVRLVRALAPRVRAWRRLRQLERSARRDAQRDVLVLDTPAALAFVAGVLRPRVFVSAPRLARLRPAHQAAVLAHERAHADRGDNLRKLVALCGSLAHGAATRRHMLDDLELACEQACDEVAARSCGGHLVVAGALLEAARTRSASATLPAAVSSFESHLAQRVEALLAAPTQPPAATPRWRRVAGAAALAVTCTLAAEPLHHATETLIDLVVARL